MNLNERKLLKLINESAFFFDNVFKVLKVILYYEYLCNKPQNEYDFGIPKLNLRFNYKKMKFEDFMDNVVSFIDDYAKNNKDDIFLEKEIVDISIKMLTTYNTTKTTWDYFQNFYRDNEEWNNDYDKIGDEE